MISGDALGLILVYAYVGIMVVITAKWSFLREHSFHRKFIHVMIGNIALFWWVFDTNYVMSLLAAAPFIPLLLLFSRYGLRFLAPQNLLQVDQGHDGIANADCAVDRIRRLRQVGRILVIPDFPHFRYIHTTEMAGNLEDEDLNLIRARFK